MIIIHEVNTQQCANLKWRQISILIRNDGENSQFFIHFKTIQIKNQINEVQGIWCYFKYMQFGHQLFLVFPTWSTFNSNREMPQLYIFLAWIFLGVTPKIFYTNYIETWYGDLLLFNGVIGSTMPLFPNFCADIPIYKILPFYVILQQIFKIGIK